MSKYYVQCGNIDLVLESESPAQAALAVMDRALAPHVWIFDDPGLTDEDCRQHLMLEALLHMPTDITVSERGFGSDDAVKVPVPETVQTWHALMVGIQRLFTSAGIDRTVAVLAGANATGEVFNRPRRAK